MEFLFGWKTLVVIFVVSWAGWLLTGGWRKNKDQSDE